VHVVADDPADDPLQVPVDDPDAILDLDIEDLGRVEVLAPALEVEVSTVTRTESTVGRSPAAVFVVTNEMIRRSGARSIPEVLRLVPGVDVARIDSNKWAVSVRGFNGRFANTLLVQIDGRSVYTPLYAGVFWDVQDLVLEDIERIEVIRGPGAAVWGANAVNGVINIITKKARDTQGVLVEGGAGTEELGFTTARYGGQLGANSHYRVYGKWFERGGGHYPLDDVPPDDWRQGRGGFRVDWTPTDCDTITFQGDGYEGYSGTNSLVADPNPLSGFVRSVNDDAHVSGANVLARWTRELSDESDWSVQFYYDRTQRHLTGFTFLEDRDTVDLDFQHRFPLGDRQSVIWGFGYRNTQDVTQDALFYLDFNPDKRADDIFSYFVQDEITLYEDRLYLTVGSKFEHNDYTAFEFQPSGRLLWTPSPRHSLWASISRAVRTPSRAEDDVTSTLVPVAIFPTPFGPMPVIPQLIGDRSMEAEDLLAYEAGIRVQPTDAFFWDLAVFFNQYNDLLTTVPGTPVPGFALGWPGLALFQPMRPTNLMDGETYGFELAANYQFCPAWRIQGAYTFLRMALHPDPGTQALSTEGQNPANQFSIWLSGDLACHWNLDLIGRYVDTLPDQPVPSYFVMDVRLAWRPTDAFEAFVAGRHLLDDSHPEFASDFALGAGTEVQSEVYGGVIWRY
jgi:iron complex outermembrane receptor protein